MASTRKRSNGWEFVVDIGPDPATGKRRQKTGSGYRTKKLAEQAAADLVAKLARGNYVEESNITINQFAEDWLRHYRSGGYGRPAKSASIRNRTFEIKRLTIRLGALRLRAVTTKIYQDFLFDLFDSGLAHNTLSGTHGACRMFFRRAVEQGLIEKDPTAYAKIPRRPDAEEAEDELPRYLEKDELVRLLEAAEGSPDAAWLGLHTLAYTGLRVGELVALKKEDIDFKEGTLTVRRTIFNPGEKINEYTTNTPKTKSSRRKIILDPMTLEAISAHLADQNQIRMKYRDRYHDAGFIFCRTKADYPGYPTPKNRFSYRMKAALKKAGLPTHLSPHSLRHTHISLLAEAGVPLEEIYERVGHTDDRTTRAIYLHMTKDIKRDAAQKFSALMASVSKK